ncbi:hypothetical protein EBZ39_05345, partial [bacterium]|nr:hypothetical protein [bacterium]
MLTTANLTLTNLTQSGVIFAGSGGALTQDTTNFNFDNSTDQLSISQTATERLTNGSFTGSASGWTLTTGWAYASNAVSHTTNGTGTLSQIPTLQWGERWEISFTLSAFTAGSVTVAFGGNTLGTFSTNGTYVFRVTNTNVANGIAFAPTNTARFTVDNVSAKVLTGGRVNTGDLYVQGSGLSGTVYISATAKSNGLPGTTRHLSLENGGGNSWIDFKFSGADKAHIGATSSGEVSTWVSGGNYDVVYNKNNSSVISFNAPSVFGHYGFGGFQNGVNAGSTTTPTSTLMSQGGTALKVKYITANQTLDNTATEWIVDPSTPICSGSPSNACSSYNNEADCLARDAHGGCSWFAGYSCNVFNGDQGSCQAQAGCTYESASCSGFGDQTTCESYSGCSWTNDPQSCVGFDQSTCD